MSEKIIWNEGFSVGNQLIDSQHQRLLGLCNALADCVDLSGLDSDFHFHEILNELAAYAREHFVTEEKLLEKLNYPELETQRQDHFRYEEKVTDILSSATFGKLEKKELFAFLRDWWCHHILVGDMAYRNFLLHAGTRSAA